MSGDVTGLNHLLKSPFSIHPKTGMVCVPFDPARFDDFDPAAVPTLDQLIHELNELNNPSDKKDLSSAHLLPYKHTSLRQAIELFEAFTETVSKDTTVNSNKVCRKTLFTESNESSLSSVQF
ncbi:unnamed protein product [Protopolystoma xenopodis]|uniref:Uncharacterized protein n=1 Tax=Protopolystoma xenopodis TaxID=117903 RepID=A0A3S5FCU1_9PLAT|nr:unnamed protein product [Protopolystoma xenopodis]